MSNISLNKLQKIIREELTKFSLLESDQMKAALDHAEAAVKCLDAIGKYKEVASQKSLAELGDSLEKVEKVLNRVFKSPSEYFDMVSEPSKDAEILDSSSEFSGSKKPTPKATATIKPKMKKPNSDLL